MGDRIRIDIEYKGNKKETEKRRKRAFLIEKGGEGDDEDLREIDEIMEK